LVELPLFPRPTSAASMSSGNTSSPLTVARDYEPHSFNPESK